MKDDKEKKRISRLTAIITQLQTKRLVTSTELAKKYSVSVRTIYRDIRSLEQAGIPIMTEEGKGFSLMEHYRLPPVMLSENEANALIIAEQLVLKNKDASFIKDYSDAIVKIKAVLTSNMKEKANLLADRTRFSQNIDQKRSSSTLSNLQLAITNFLLTEIDYQNEAGKLTKRTVEPFALLNTTETWLLVAWCRLRKDFRYFRLDRMKTMKLLPGKFKPHNLTLQEFFEKTEKS